MIYKREDIILRIGFTDHLWYFSLLFQGKDCLHRSKLDVISGHGVAEL